jgi:hypothetical protein
MFWGSRAAVARVLFLAVTTVTVTIAILGGPGSSAAQVAQLPLVYLNTTYVAPTGAVIRVMAGGDLQAALNAAQPGNVIELQAGATFTGNFTLPNKTGTGWIHIRSSALSSLPAPGSRVSPAHAALMPKIVTPNSTAAIKAAPGAHHYRLIGLEVRPAAGVFAMSLLDLGDYYVASESALPSNIIVDRSYLHGDPTRGSRRGVGLNGRAQAVIDSYLADFKEASSDGGYAIHGLTGPGPFRIVNNFLQASGINILFGGGPDPKISGLVPADMEIRHNHIAKLPAWRGSGWIVKNLFELKNARRVLVEGNIFEYCWPASQSGFALVFTPRNQEGGAPWAAVKDVTFRGNLVRHVSSAINIMGSDDMNPSDRVERLHIHDNLFEDVDGARWGGSGWLIKMLNYAKGSYQVVVEHNTAFQSSHLLFADGGTHEGFVYRNNLSRRGAGVGGSGTGEGVASLTRYWPGADFRRNVLVAGDTSRYPATNYFPAVLDAVGFLDLAGGDYSLSAVSLYKNAGTDGKDVGANIELLEAALAGETAPAPPVITPPSDTTAPTVTLTSPASSQTISGTVLMSATATDNTGVAGVQFTVNGAKLGADDTATPYAVSWNTTTGLDGTYTLRAVARDAAGNVTTSNSVSVTVLNADRTAPAVSVTAPATVTGTVTVSASATDNIGVVGVRFRLDGADLAVEDTSAPYSATWNTTTATNGTHALTAVARDAAGNTTTSTGLTVTVANTTSGDTTFPTISITSPASGGTVSGTVTVAATGSDDRGVAGVRFFVDGAAVGTEDTTAPYAVSWDTAVSASAVATRTLTAVARDAAGNATTSPAVLVTVGAAARSPFGGVPAPVPGLIQAENFDLGGQGAAYFKTTPGNVAGQYRPAEGVSIYTATGAYIVNTFQTGDWLTYTINVTQPGTYRLEALVSTEFTSTRWHAEIDGVDVTGPVLVPHTGSWWTFQWVGVGGVSLTAGQHTLKVVADQQYFNLDALRVSALLP